MCSEKHTVGDGASFPHSTVSPGELLQHVQETYSTIMNDQTVVLKFYNEMCARIVEY